MSAETHSCTPELSRFLCPPPHPEEDLPAGPVRVCVYGVCPALYCQVAEIPAKKLKRGHRTKNLWPNFG